MTRCQFTATDQVASGITLFSGAKFSETHDCARLCLAPPTPKEAASKFRNTAIVAARLDYTIKRPLGASRLLDRKNMYPPGLPIVVWEPS